MGDIPESVYREAARVGLLEWGYGELATNELEGVVAREAGDSGVRAAVESAYRAGILAAQRAALVAMERDRQAWGPTKAASGVYDMCRRVVREQLDALAGTP